MVVTPSITFSFGMTSHISNSIDSHQPSMALSSIIQLCVCVFVWIGEDKVGPSLDK